MVRGVAGAGAGSGPRGLASARRGAGRRGPGRGRSTSRPAALNDSLSPIYFAAGTTQIRPNDTRILDAHAAWLRGNRTQRLLIEGHTDSAGDSAFSRQVGVQRAKSAKAYLVARGVSADQITASAGDGVPTCGERTATCRAANRRATFSTEARP